MIPAADIEAQRTVVEAFRAKARRHETAFEATSDASTMVWHEWGAGPVLVLLHGGFGSWRHWIRNIDALSTHFRVLAADTPGLGESAAVSETTDPAGIGQIVARGIQHLVGNDPIHIAAFSFGGVVAGQVALNLWEQVESLTLCGASGMGLKREKMMLVRRVPEMTETEKLEANVENLKRLMLYNHDAFDPLAAFIHIENDRMARLRSRRMSMGDTLAKALDVLGQRNIQLNGIWGEHDITAAPWIDDRKSMLARYCATSRFVSISNAGHWVSYEAPDVFNDTLIDFLQP